jgi:light-regulated signal transduction histidine kinase (bacteriophytochrome)
MSQAEQEQLIMQLQSRVAELETDIQLRALEAAARIADLEQFVYIVSHDLQEPLRMVTSYVQLLARRYTGKLDQDADDFIGFAVDGSTRMQTLLGELLDYSRIASRGKAFVSIALEPVWDRVLARLQAEIGKTGATITHAPLPVVSADAPQMTLLFHNLIENALKFHGEAAPHIHVSCERREREYLIGVHDRGLGIDPKDAQRIFVIFQRLHPRDAYPGTGLGLALCKRVVERHHGRLWVESTPGHGATFFFTLTAAEEHPS